MRAQRQILDIKSNMSSHIENVFLNARASPALDEGVHRLRLCGSRYTRLENVRDDTRQAYHLMSQLGESVQRCAPTCSAVSLSPAVPNDSCLRVACINPHRNGLLDVAGSAVAWYRLKDPQLGLLHTMQEFNFAFIGLPACRVFADFALPMALGADLFSIGGASYTSVGVLRPLELTISSEIIHSESSAYSLIYVLEGIVFVVFSLPTPSGVESDKEWCKQLRLGKEAGCRVAGTLGVHDIVWMSDFNYEPEEISGRPDPRKQCRGLWESVVQNPPMWLMNPSGHDENGKFDLQPVRLETQAKEVWLRCSATFQQGGRGIDLTLVSSSLKQHASLINHNGIDCARHGCTRGWCREVARSDHFLQDLSIRKACLRGRDSLTAMSRPRLPDGFKETVHWKNELQNLLPLAAVLNVLLAPSVEDWKLRAKNCRLRQLESDVAAVSVEMFFLLAIVMWCCKPGVALNCGRNLASTFDPAKWKNRLIEEAAKSKTKSEALTNLCRAIKPIVPQPPIIMKTGSERASAEKSHEGWRKRILEEKEWLEAPPADMLRQVRLQERRILQEAQTQSTRECDDISLTEVKRELQKWGNSLGLPSDWIPRAALRTGLGEIDVLVWSMICKAWRLQVRPQSWGITRQVALFKKGDVDVYKSWRNIMINTQMGLLMERLFWNRVVGEVRQALGKYQTGYVHRCEYHALAFHEVAASRLWLGVGMVALLGDLVGAFPKAWRELIVVLAKVEAGINGSLLVLLREFLKHTAVEVAYSGKSTVPTVSGLPEGGMLGPLCYPLLPRLLDKSLAAAGAGIAVSVAPSQYEQMEGLSATDRQSAVQLTRIDAEAESRLHVLLIADDQIMPESSLVKLQESAVLASEWASLTGQAYHVETPEKTAVLVLGQAEREATYVQHPIMLAGSQVPYVTERK